MRLAGINLAVFVALLVAALGAAEAWLRLTVPASSEESIFEYTLETGRYKRMRPNASIIAWGKELRTNSLGFRDRHATLPAKQPDEFRIAVLGDSFTLSAGVEHERIYTSVLEDMLRSRQPGVRVVNLAVSGYNIRQYELVLQEVALGLQPDLLIVAVFPTNDFSNEGMEGNLRRARGDPAPPPPAFPRNLHIWRAWLGRVAAKLSPEPKPASTDTGWEDNIAALERIIATAKSERLPIVVATLPHTRNFQSQRALHSRVLRFCEQLGVPTVGLLDLFIAAGVEESSLRLNAIDSHPNEHYNLLAARAFAARLGDLVDPPASSAQASPVLLP